MIYLTECDFVRFAKEAFEGRAKKLSSIMPTSFLLALSY